MAEEEMLAEMRRMAEKIAKCKEGIREMQAILDLWEMNYANIEMQYRNLKENKESASSENRFGRVGHVSTTSATTSSNSSGRYDASLASSELAVSATLSRSAGPTAENTPQPNGKHQVFPESKTPSSETSVGAYTSKTSAPVTSVDHQLARVQPKDNPLFSLIEAQERVGKRDINVDKATGGTPVHFKQNADIRTSLIQQSSNYSAVSNTEPSFVQPKTSGAPSAMLSTTFLNSQSLSDSVDVNQGPKLNKTLQAAREAPASDVQSGAEDVFSLSKNSKPSELSHIKDEIEEEDVSSDEEADISKQLSKRLKRVGEGEGRRENKYLEQVKNFLETKKERIQEIFKSYERQHEKNPILCEKTDKGNYKISPEQRRLYNLPRGIQGTQARHGQQNFNILLHNVVLSGVKLGLQGEHVNFVDPRDAAEVLKQVQGEYEKFLEEIKQK